MSKIKIKPKLAPPRLALLLAAFGKAVPNVRGKGFDFDLDVPGIDGVKVTLPDTLDPDGPLGQQLGAVLGQDIAGGIDLADLERKQAFVLLVPKRGSGGKYAHSVEAILAPEIVKRAAASLHTTATPTHSPEVQTRTE